MPNLLIVGSTNNGKSMIIEKFRRAHLSNPSEEADHETIPIVVMQMPSEPTVARFYALLMAQLGAPFRLHVRVADIEHQALRILRAVGVRILVIDELHNMLVGRQSTQREFLNLIRFLGNELQIAIVGVALPSTPMSNVDRDPPVALLDRLTAQTGISLPQLRAMTLHGYVPFLIDGINPTETAFEVYGGSFTTLMSPAARRRVPLGRPWAPWVDPKWLERRYGCPSCLAADVVPHHRIPWRLPWMASCPVHGMLLEKVFIPTGPSQAYAEYHRTIGTPATPELRLIDGITRTAVIDGMVYLSNGERISAAVWVRKLRGLIDEVTRPSLVVRSARAVIGSAWVAVAGRFRAGLGRWHPFEEMPIDKQAIVLRVTGVVVGAMLKGESPVATSAYPRSVSDREFLRPTPPPRADLRSVYVATQIKASGQSKLQPEMDEPDVLIVRAQSDRTAAYEIRRLLVGGKHSPERIAAIERDLRALGIPIVTNIET